MGKEEIFNYVMETPGNTNPNVLRSLLDNELSGTAFIVKSTYNNGVTTLDKTWQEIYDAAKVRPVLLVEEFSGTLSSVPLYACGETNHRVVFVQYDVDEALADYHLAVVNDEYFADSANDYPFKLT